MPIEVREETGGNVVDIRVLGEVVKQDYKTFVFEFERLVHVHGRLRVLFDVAGFAGLDAGAAWEELKFDIKHFADMERIAVVGDRKWEHAMAIFFNPFTHATIRYFDHADAVDARKWLHENGVSAAAGQNG